MTHELMFEDDDPVLARVRSIALTLPEAQEKVSHGRPAFFTDKVFAYYSGSLKVDGEWVQHPRSVVVQADTAEREVLRRMPGTYVPGYLGVAGWTGVDLDAATDWDEVTELIEESYRVTAPVRLVALLDLPR
ncbi:MAG TPA: MmcQ/YjbR family DNA-binding protein [Homoserinimonas sp.]|nr:MmcQ/YjbR family DNA-binding protein [Homoserinimonas sp.]